MSLGESVGMRTVSITWTMPLLVFTSGVTTVAPFTITLSPTVKESDCPLAVSAVMHSESALEGTRPATTW